MFYFIFLICHCSIERSVHVSVVKGKGKSQIKEAAAKEGHEILRLLASQNNFSKGEKMVSIHNIVKSKGPSQHLKRFSSDNLNTCYLFASVFHLQDEFAIHSREKRALLFRLAS